MGVENQSLEQALQKLKFLFQVTGMKLPYQTKPNIMYFLFNFVWCHTDLFSSTRHLVVSIVNRSNALEVLFLAPCLVFSFLGDIKAICYMIKYSEVHQLIDDMIELEAKESINLEIANEIKVVETNFLNRVIRVFITLTYLMIFVFNVGPLPLIAITYYSTGELKLFLPFLNIYPFDVLVFKYWPFAYIHQIWTVIVVLIYATAMDCIIFVCCTFLRIQFRILQADIKHLIPVRPIMRRKFKGDVHFNAQFKEILQRHQEIIRITNVLEHTFSMAFLLNFISSSFIICLTGFNVVIVKDITLRVTFIIFLLMGLIQVWCLCYFGELLMNSSVEVSNAVYESQWYLAAEDISKQLMLVQTRAHNPCKLTALGFADVNLGAFMQILSKAWSYFALLNTIYAR